LNGQQIRSTLCGDCGSTTRIAAAKERVMQTSFGHIVFGVQPANLPFYRDLFGFLGWRTIYDGEDMLAVGDANRVSLWFGTQLKDAPNDYDGPGMNHFAVHTASQADVDTAAAFMRERGVELLFDTPRHRAEFSHGDDDTYYQIMFETPDRLLVEVVYIGPRQA
jgi:catechol 2,3-dioxygenase-like lactoylglutathione lyase family enzyme